MTSQHKNACSILFILKNGGNNVIIVFNYDTIWVSYGGLCLFAQLPSENGHLQEGNGQKHKI